MAPSRSPSFVTEPLAGGEIERQSPAMLQGFERPLCWAVSDHKEGNAVQALGLAEALRLQPCAKLVQPRALWSRLPAQLLPPGMAAVGLGDLDWLRPPWPDVAIGVGYNAVRPLLAIREASRREKPDRPAFTIQVQRPSVPVERFDLVIVPRHDRLSGANVLPMLGSIHRVTGPRLSAAGAALAPRLSHLPPKRIAVLLGGHSKVHRFDEARARQLGRDLARLARAEGAGLLVTPSRRSAAGTVEALLQALADVPHFFWDGRADNPYYGILASSQAAIVTEDSVNMVTEAAAAGLPVLVVGLEGGSSKFKHFHADMREAGLTRPFDGRLETWQPPAFDEMQKLTAAVAAALPFRDAA